MIIAGETNPSEFVSGCPGIHRPVSRSPPEDRTVNSLDGKGEVFHAPRDINQAALGKDEFLIFQPELDFSAQFPRIIPDRSHESQGFIEIVSMGYLHLQIAGAFLFPQPDAICVKSPLGDSIVQGKHPGGFDVIAFFSLLQNSLGDGERLLRWLNIREDVFCILGFSQFLFSLFESSRYIIFLVVLRTF